MTVEFPMNVNLCWTRIVGYLTSIIMVVSYILAYDDLDFSEPESTVIPYFNPRPKNVSFMAGTDALLKCSVSNLEARYVTWRKMEAPNPISIGDYIYSPDYRFSIVQIREKDEWNLKIKNVETKDSGIYKCQVSSRNKDLFKLVLLRVTNPPPTVKPEVTLNGTRFVSRGDPIVLTCNATSNTIAPEALDWFKGGNKVPQRSTNRVKITNFQLEKTLMSTLIIKRSSMEDAAMYICRSSELDIAQFQVHVLDEVPTKNVKRGYGAKTPEGTVKDGVSSSYSCFQCLTIFAIGSVTFRISVYLMVYPT